MNKKNRPLRVFISGPMSIKKLFNFPAFDEARDKLKAAGYDVVSPADLDREAGFDPTKWKEHGYFGCRGVECKYGLCIAERSGWTWRPKWFDLYAAMKRDSEELRKCDGVALLDGCEESEGARQEAAAATDVGITAVPIEDWLAFSEEEVGEMCEQDLATLADDERIPLPRAELLDEAKRLICGDRNAQYGSPTQDFERTAALLNAMGYRNCTHGTKELKGADVALVMVCLKMSRLAWQRGKRDSWVDLAGYAACGYETALRG